MTIAARQVSQSRRIGNLYELLPDVFAREKTPERLRRPLESLHNVDLGSNLPGRSPARELGDCFPKAGSEGQDQEAAHGRASEDEVQIVADWRHLSEVVVAGDRAAHHDPCPGGEVSQCSIENLPTDVVEVHVDPVRAQFTKPSRDVLAPMIDRPIEAEVLNEKGALLLAARDADDPTPLELADLRDERTGRAGGGGHDDHVAGLGGGEIKKPEVSRQSRDAE